MSNKKMAVSRSTGSKNKNSKIRNVAKTHFFHLSLAITICAIVSVAAIYITVNTNLFSFKYILTKTDFDISKILPKHNVLDKEDYDQRMLVLANDITFTSSSTASTTTMAISLAGSKDSSTTATSTHLWPVKTVYPNVGAILPFNRIVAFYGNFYSTKMGVLGQYPEEEMLSKLNVEVQKWQAADPTTPVIPAIDYIAITAQGSAGADGKYRARMPDDQIAHAIELAQKVNGIVILDLQVGLSNLQTEVPLLASYLKIPQVHLAIDPEFDMKTGARPGTVIGTVDAADVNYVANYLAKIVQENNLPPKILVVHRFTRPMVTNYKNILPLPEVQIVMDMDGWGSPSRKMGTYNAVVYKEPVQFAGFKLFYSNDLRAPSTHMMTPAEVLKLKPRPIFIQYQ